MCVRPRSHLCALAACPDVEHPVHDGVHAGVGAGEEEQALLDAFVHFQSGFPVVPVPGKMSVLTTS